MEPSTALPPLSRVKNISGWEPKATCKLRRGQRDLLRSTILNPLQRQFNAYLPTGYGKTICSMLVYGSLRGQGRVDRALVIVPSIQQLRDYRKGLKKVCKTIGLEISDHEVCGEVRALRVCRSGEAEIFVTTIQAIYADFEKQGRRNFNNGYYADLLKTGRWLIVADEHHHYRENKAWGDALNSLRFEVRLGLSATPLSSRGEVSVIGDAYDVIVSIPEAYKEQAIRRIRGHIMEHHVDIMVGDSDEVIQVTTTDIAEDLMKNESVQSWEVRKKVRYCSNYLSQTMGAAVSALNMKRLQQPGEHQMLVFAMSCRHAKHVSDMLNSAYGDEEKFSDWIGTGPDGRADNENDDIVDQYKENRLTCLVQVNKAGEGFDNPRSSVLVFVNSGTSDSNNSKQHFGRGFRRNYGIDKFDDDVCDIFVSSDSDLVSLVRTLQWDTKRSDVDPDDDDFFGGDGEDEIDRFYAIPDLIIIQTKLNYTETVEPLGSVAEAARRLREIDPVQFGNRSEADLLDAVYKAMYRRKKEFEAQSEADTLQSIRGQVDDASRQLANQAAKLRYGPSVPHGGHGKIKKAINARWKMEGGLAHEAMTRSEFAKKHKWIQHINNTISSDRSLEAFPWLMV